MKIKWLKEQSYHPEYGLLEVGKTYDVPASIARTWIESGHAEEVRPSRGKSKEEVKDDESDSQT